MATIRRKAELLSAHGNTKGGIAMNYAVLTFLFNFFELGCFLLAFQLFGLKKAITLSVCVKIGRLATETLRGKSFPIILMLWVFGIAIGIGSSDKWLASCVASMIIVFCISKVREHYRSTESSSKRYKVVSRIIAFSIAPFFNYWILLPFAIFYFFKTISEKKLLEEKNPCFPDLKNAQWEYVLLSVHHMHYFAYAFLIPYISVEVFHINILWTGIIFVVGWCAYNIYENKIASTFNNIAIGHIIACIGIGMIWIFSQSFIALLLGWLLTGMGGGTYYMIKEKLPPHRGTSEIVELWGQLSGMVILAVSVCLNTFTVAYVCGIVFSGVTVVIAIYLKRRKI